MNAISQKQLDRILYLAISRTYLSAIIEATPGKGVVAGEWEMRVDKENVVIFNEEFGDIVLYLEEGTDENIIRAKNKKFLKFKKGTDENIIRAKNKKFLKFKKGTGTRKNSKKIPGNVAFEKDGYIFAKAVRHPGIKARLFIQKVLNDSSLKREFKTVYEGLLRKELKI